MDKIINILKPTGMTSHDVVSAVRKILGIKKVGHTGTLDPDASGVLPICIGRATKVSELIITKDKTYLCELTLGISTDTYDSSGNVLNRNLNTCVSEEDLKEAFYTQRGVILQYPPIYSALKVDGKKMCDLARSGKEVKIKLKPRKVQIKELEIIRFDGIKVVFMVKCTKGTYVRSICKDIGDFLGCGAHMSALIRTSSGKFDIDDSITLDKLETEYKNCNIDKYLFDIDYVLSDFNYIVLNDNAVKYYSNGGIIEEYRFYKKNYCSGDKFIRVYSKGKFLGIGELKNLNNKIIVKSYKIFV